MVNGSEIIDKPWDTIFSPFTDLLSNGFWLIPIGFIGVALYVKTHNLTATGVWLTISSLLLASGNIYTGFPELAFVYLIFTVIGIMGIVVDIYFMRK